MAKGNSRRLFLRIIKSLNIEERIVCLLLCIVIVITSIHGITDFIRTGGIAFAEGGSFVEGIISIPPALLNPVYAQTAEANRDVSTLIFSGLVKYDPVSETFVSDLADFTLSDDKKTYTFTVKPGILWHDDVPFTVDDILFTYQQVIQNEGFQNRLLKANFDDVTIQKLNDQQISFSLLAPNSFFISNFSVGILPSHLLKDLSIEELKLDQFNFHPIGTGPYKVEQPLEVLNDGRQRLILKSFDRYYGAKPKISVIKFNFYPDQEVMANDLSGLNLIAKIPMNKLEKIQTSHRFNFIEYELPQYTALFFNLDRDNVKNVILRRALSLALDRNEIIKNLEYKKLINSPLLELKQEELGAQPNLEESIKLMKGLGYAPSTPENDKAKLKQLELKLMVRSYDPSSLQYKELDTLTNYFRTQWSQIGVVLVVEPEDEGSFNDRLGSKDYDLVLSGQNLGYNGDLYSFWHSTQAGENGLNLSNYRSFAVDNFIEKIRLSFDKEERVNLMTVLAATINEDYPAIFLYQPSYLLATDDKVKDISMQNLAYPSDRYSLISQWCVMNCQ